MIRKRNRRRKKKKKRRRESKLKASLQVQKKKRKNHLLHHQKMRKTEKEKRSQRDQRRVKNQVRPKSPNHLKITKLTCLSLIVLFHSILLKPLSLSLIPHQDLASYLLHKFLNNNNSNRLLLNRQTC